MRKALFVAVMLAIIPFSFAVDVRTLMVGAGDVMQVVGSDVQLVDNGMGNPDVSGRVFDFRSGDAKGSVGVYVGYDSMYGSLDEFMSTMRSHGMECHKYSTFVSCRKFPAAYAGYRHRQIREYFALLGRDSHGKVTLQISSRSLYNTTDLLGRLESHLADVVRSKAAGLSPVAASTSTTSSTTSSTTTIKTTTTNMGLITTTSIHITSTSIIRKKPASPGQAGQKPSAESELEKFAKSHNMSTERIRTERGMLEKAVQPDRAIEAEHPETKKNSDMWFKLKYGMNKYVLNPVVDVIAGKLPGIGLFKDYFKNDKDTNLFDDDAKKVQKDLGVDKKSAQLYSQLSGVEEREQALSPAKNAVNIPASGKPMQFAMDALTMGTKKIIARYYRKEYSYIIKQAKYYRSHGMKWADVHKAVKRDVGEIEDAMTGMGSAEEKTATQYLNTMSKGQYKDVKARIDLYILQAMENGELK